MTPLLTDRSSAQHHWRIFVSKTASFWLVAALTAAVAAPAAAQDRTAGSADGNKASSTAAQDSDREKARALIAQVMSQSAPTPGVTAAAQPAGPVVQLTSDEAVQRALDNNLTLASQRITPETWDLQIAATLANYRPNLTSTFSNQNAVQLNTNIFSGGTRVTQQTQNWSGGLAQNVWWGGGAYAINWNNSRSASDANNTTVNPNYSSGLQLQFTQPLLRNFKTDSNRAQVQTNRISQDISELDLKAATASTVAQVRQAYWELVYARQAVDAAQASLDLASKLVADNRSRVEIGTMAPIDVVQAQADEATRRQTLVSAQATLRNDELALKRLIVSGTDDELWRATIVPTDLPTAAPVAIDLEGAVQTALENRTDLEATRKNLEATDVQMRSLVNQTLPQLDVIGTYGLNGRGGTLIDRDRISGNILGTTPGGYLDALQNISGLDAPTWNARVQFALPIGTSAPKANLARQRLLRRQTEAQIKGTELQIATDVTTAALAIRNSLEAMQTASVARDLSEQRLQAAQSKFDVGMASNFEVLQAQRDLADARNRELRETLNYQRALVDFDRVQISPR
jgi:outer membrane protein TolC